MHKQQQQKLISLMLLVKLLHDLVYSVCFFNKSIQLEIKDHVQIKSALERQSGCGQCVVLTFENMSYYYRFIHKDLDLKFVLCY